MKNPYKTLLEEFVKKKINNSTSVENKGISIITCTNKLYSFDQILDNFNRQDFIEKELIIIINNNKINEINWKNKISKYANIRIFRLEENISLGNCLNFAVQKSIYPIVARFDDDDYYGPKYLSDSIKSFDNANTKLIGKHTIYVYFTKEKNLAIKDQGHENQFLYFLNGATMLFKKEIFKKIRFRNISVNEDVFFCKDCVKSGIMPYSGNKYHFVYLRHPSTNNHTWKISNKHLMKLYCNLVGNVDDFKPYINI